MKKFQLFISQPCHEQWDNMSPYDKGKFCGACQKTVIDFSTMSDRQLAAFFKKPKTGVCGRFYQDQLDRDIVINKKRIPWIRYFFQFTWPVMVWMLKSCGLKTKTMGVMTNKTTSHPVTKNGLPIALMGDTVAQVTPVDTLINAGSLKNKTEKTKGQLSVRACHDIDGNVLQGDRWISKDEEADDPTKYNILTPKPEDKFMLQKWQPLISGMVMGGLSIAKPDIRFEETETKSMDMPIANHEAAAYTVFPNPVRAGNLLTVSFSHPDEMPFQVQIMDASGRMITSTQQDMSVEATVFNVRIPAQILPGVYFLRLTAGKNKVDTKKIIVQ